MIQLRSYQTECLQAITSNLSDGIFSQVVHLPTASGKTVIFASLIAQAIKADPSTRALVLAFSTDLLGQARDKLKMIAPDLDVGIVDADHKEFDRQIVVSSVQSARISGNLAQLQAQDFKICIADECHHFACDTARHVLNELGFGYDCATYRKLLVGFSATPFRSDAKGLGEIFDKIVYHRSTKEMIEDNYLCRPIGNRVVTDIDFSQIAVESGDFATSALSSVMNTDAVNQTIVSSYLERCAGRKTIAFCTSIDHAVKLAECFKQFGVFSEAIHSNLSIVERESIKQKFSDGAIEVLTNPLMLTEGYDEPSISCVIIARPTKSAGLYQQMAGRGLRLHPTKKDCMILDFGDQAHTLCNVGVLLNDELDEEKKDQPRKNEHVEDLIKNLPPNINPKLKKAILELDLLGDSFAWLKDANGFYFLKGAGDVVLKLIKTGSDRYDVILIGAKGTRVIAKGLDFSYSFSAAEDFARANRALFAISDLEAAWRFQPISEKQKGVFRSGGYKNGIDELTKGQASDIIASGVLRKKKATTSRK